MMDTAEPVPPHTGERVRAEYLGDDSGDLSPGSGIILRGIRAPLGEGGAGRGDGPSSQEEMQGLAGVGEDVTVNKCTISSLLA